MILDSINQGIVVVDEFSQLVAWNDKFLRLYSMSENALHKGMELQSFSELFASSANNPMLATALSSNNKLGALGQGDYLDVLADGTAIEIRVSDRNSGGLIATYTDVTAHFETEAKLRTQRKLLTGQVAQLQSLGKSLEEARKQAVHSDQQKSRFLAMISHEIRTPMSAIISSLELLSDSGHPQDQERLREVALASGRQMLFLLSDIIEVSKTDGWNFTIEVEDVKITELLTSIVDAWQPFAGQKNISLDLKIGPAFPTYMRTDPKRLRQVIDNLVSNAIKFTEVGSVNISAGIDSTPEGNVVQVRVHDTGRGISQDMQHKLFKEFSRVENSTSPKVDGTGLGLSIAKRIVTSMDGKIGAESKADQGSTFTIQLPFVPVKQIHKLQLSSPPAPSEVIDKDRAPCVLIADDNEISRIVLASALERLGCKTVSAADGIQAFEIFETQHFDLILMDHHMPISNGLDATKRIRAMTTKKKSTPVIGLTASEDHDEKTAMLDAGMSVVYTKPLSKSDLNSILAEYLD